MDQDHEHWLREAIRLASEGAVANRGGPFGAVVVREGMVLGRGENRVLSTNDPTAHAEIVAIRAACQAAGMFHLPGAILYASCEPCPMCLSAIYWARIENVFYAATAADAADAGFADEFIRRELPLSPDRRSVRSTHLLSPDSITPFDAWRAKADRIMY